MKCVLNTNAVSAAMMGEPNVLARMQAVGLVKAQLEHKGKRIEDFDAAIAAHALATGAILVTANIKHMARVPGLVIEDWLDPIG